MPQPPFKARRPMTLTQKILAQHALGLTRPWVEAGDVVRIRVDWTMASELAWGGMDRTHRRLGRPELQEPERVFLAIDHTADPVTLATDPRAQRLAELARSFAARAQIRHFHDANQTILHTRFYRELVEPGQVVLGADSHTTSHGGAGAFAIGLGGSDVLAAMLVGETWIEVPEAVAVEYRGVPGFGIGGKDIILKTLKDLGRNTVALERSVEYLGPGLRQWSMDTRFTIANMTAEFGGLSGIFEADQRTADFLERRSTPSEAKYWRADPEAPYAARHVIDLDRLQPLVAKPFSPDNVVSVEELAGHPIDGCFIGSCTTTEEELVLAALVLEQAFSDRPARHASPKQLVIPGDRTIHARLLERDLWRHYQRAGFRVGLPGCSMCLGVASEKAQPGEAWLSSQNRNYENRMGPGSFAYLASAASVAASALAMKVTDPRPYLQAVDRDRMARLLDRDSERPLPNISLRDPEILYKTARVAEPPSTRELPAARLRGRVQRFGDDVDTDAIIAGEFCHLSDFSALGERAFHWVRPDFAELARKGRTLIVAGRSFGTGSSREQAVWALLGAGIQCVVARSFAFIHKRNLVNEGLSFLVIRDSRFYELATEDSELELDWEGFTVRHLESGILFRPEAPSRIVHALQQTGGLVRALERHGKRTFEILASDALDP